MKRPALVLPLLVACPPVAAWAPPMRPQRSMVSSHQNCRTATRAVGSLSPLWASSAKVIDVSFDPEEAPQEQRANPPATPLSSAYKALSIFTGSWFLLSFLAGLLSGRNPEMFASVPTLVPTLQAWLWPVTMLSSVFTVLESAAKRDRLGGTTFKLLNAAIVLSAASLVPGKTVPMAVLVAGSLPSLVALRQTGIRGLLKPMKFDLNGNSMVTTLLAILAWEAVIKAPIAGPMTLPLLRAAMCHRLHFASLEDATKGKGFGSETYEKLNAGLLYATFALIPKEATLLDYYVPIMYGVAQFQGAAIAKEAKPKSETKSFKQLWEEAKAKKDTNKEKKS